MLSQVVVDGRDGEDGSHTSDKNQVRIPVEEEMDSEPGLVRESSLRSVKSNSARPPRPEVPEMASRKLKLTWKKWLESLFEEAAGRKDHLQHRKIKTSSIMQCKVKKKRDRLEEDKFQKLRKDQEEILKTRKLLVHGVTYLPPLKVTPVPDGVDPSDWPDDLSQRMSASWRDGLSNWWDEKLGLNRDAKIEALRRKRHWAKRAKARNRVALSSSFASSVSYQDDLSEWSSAASQYLGSDAESIYYNSQSAPEDEANFDLEMLPKNTDCQRASQNTEVCSDAPQPMKSLLKTPQKTTKSSEQDKSFDTSQSPPMDFQHLPSQASTIESHSGGFSSLVASLKESHSDHPKPRPWQQRDYLGSLFGSSQEPGQDDEVTASVGWKTTRSKPSYFLSPSRTSMRTSSQASQPQKKKSRMGF